MYQSDHQVSQFRRRPDAYLICIPSPSAWLQEVRQAQQDVHNERKISDLRLEIMGVQEDVRRESESEASSGHSPLEYHSQLSSNRYQVVPPARDI